MDLYTLLLQSSDFCSILIEYWNGQIKHSHTTLREGVMIINDGISWFVYLNECVVNVIHMVAKGDQLCMNC